MHKYLLHVCHDLPQELNNELSVLYMHHSYIYRHTELVFVYMYIHTWHARMHACMHTCIHTYIYTYIPSTAAEKRARILPEPRAGRQRATTESDALFPPASAQFRPPSSPMVTLRKTRLPPACAMSAPPRHPRRRRPRAAPHAFRRRAPPRPAGRWMVGQADSRCTAIVEGGREMTATLTCISTWSSSAAFNSQVRRNDCSSIISRRIEEVCLHNSNGLLSTDKKRSRKGAARAYNYSTGF